MNNFIDIWVEAQEKRLFAEAVMLAGNKSWASKLQVEAYTLWNYINKYSSGAPPFISLKFRDFMNMVLEQYFLQNLWFSAMAETYIDEDDYVWCKEDIFLSPITFNCIELANQSIDPTSIVE